MLTKQWEIQFWRRTDRQTDGEKSALVELRFAAKNCEESERENKYYDVVNQEEASNDNKGSDTTIIQQGLKSGANSPYPVPDGRWSFS